MAFLIGAHYTAGEERSWEFVETRSSCTHNHQAAVSDARCKKIRLKICNQVSSDVFQLLENGAQRCCYPRTLSQIAASTWDTFSRASNSSVDSAEHGQLTEPHRYFF
jgi:hypothetical protein